MSDGWFLLEGGDLDSLPPYTLKAPILGGRCSLPRKS